MTRYSFASITINGKDIEIADIVNGHAIANDRFETSTFDFIQKWFGTTETFVQQTSGSTGNPKKISIARRQMIASAKLTQDALHLTSSDVALLCLDPEYIAGKMMLVRSFIADMKIVAVSPTSNPFRDLDSDQAIDFTALVPLQLNEIIHSKEIDKLNKLKNVIVGGAPVNAALQKNISGLQCHVYATYGMTETISHIALQPLNGPLQSDYFSILPGIKIAQDERGCLEIEADFLNEKITTNDLVDIRDESHFKWLGRVDNVINSGGIKIFPEKIEREIINLMDKLGRHERILITSLSEHRLGNEIVCLVEGHLENDFIQKIKRDISRNLSPYEIPKEFYTNVDFVFTLNGKLNRTATALGFEKSIRP